MATLLVPAAGGFDFDTLDFPIVSPGGSNVTTHTKTSWRVTQAATTYYEYVGTNLTYDGDFVPTGGIITGIKSVVGGVTQVQITGLSIQAADFHADFAVDDFQNFLTARVLVGNDTVTGSAGVDHLLGGDGNDVIDGKAGADKLEGGKGNDTYLLDNLLDEVVEGSTAGTDTVKTSVLITTDFDNVENYTYTGAAAWTFVGNDLDNVITGSTGKDNLTGGKGNDTLLGNGGDDTLLGGEGDDILNGGAGNDTMTGGLGNDTYIFDSIGDKLAIDDEGGSNDTFQSSALITKETTGIESYTYTGAAAWTFTATGSVDNTLSGGSGIDTLKGGAGNDTLLGNAGNDTLDGGTGNDKMSGGLGSDIYVVDSDDDTVTEAAMGGTDTIKTAVNFNLLTNGLNVENLIALGGVGNIELTGNTLVNTLTGNEGNNKLDGGTGADTMIGGAGDDTYSVDNVGDKVTELANAGTDTIESSLSYSLAALANVENLKLTGTATNGTGNAGINTITGNDEGNVLDGGAGADVMIGGKGGDLYFVDNLNDSVTEGVGEGTQDSVRTTATILNANNFANVENFTYFGTAAWTFTGTDANNQIIGATGNDHLTGGLGNDFLMGNAGNDTLVGGKGDDELNGGVGNDTYIFNVGDGEDVLRPNTFNTGDLIKLAGTDLHDLNWSIDNIDLNLAQAIDAGYDYGDTGVMTLIDFLKATGSVTVQIDLADNLAYGTNADLSTFIFQRGLTGTANTTSSEIIVGGDTNDTINGGGGFFDQIYGGEGNDTITGGSGKDWIFGGSDNDVLNGLAGNDTITGGAGNDKINGGDGIDLLNYELSDVDRGLEEEGGETGVNVDLSSGKVTNDGFFGVDTLTGIENVRGSEFADIIVGDANANELEGGDGNDILAGGAGNDQLVGGDDEDTLTGGAGNDRLVGGSGADEFRFSALGEGDDVITDFNGAEDKLSFASALDKGNGGILDDVASIAATEVGDDVVVTFANGHTLTFLGAATGSIDSFDDLLADPNAQFTTFLDANRIVTGGVGNDVLAGGAGDDTLTGNAGNDTLEGGVGNDILNGGIGNDTYIFNIGDGEDTLAAGTYNTGDIIKLAGTDVYDFNYEWNGKDLILAQAVDENYDFADTGKLTLAGFLGGTGSITVQIDTANYDEFYGTDANLSTFVMQRGLTGTNNATTAEVIIGTDGNDVINGNGGYYDALYGGKGNDIITGGSGTDWIRAGEGNDVLNGAAGNDTLRGEAGNDTLNGGDGIDRADYKNSDDSVIVDLSLGKALDDGFGTTDTLNSIENVRGSSHDDTIIGDGNANRLEGRDGDDLIAGGAGDDDLVGGDGADTFRFSAFGEGDDIIEDFDGSQDKLSFASALDTGNDGILNDLATATVTEDGPNVIVTFANGHTLTLWGAATGSINSIDDLVADPNTQFTTFIDSDKTLTGGAGNDAIGGGAGHDHLIGAAGNDTLTGGLGNDYLDGGAGNDVYNFSVGDGFDVVGSGTYNTGDVIKLAGTNVYDLNYDWDGTNLFIAQAVDSDYDFADTGKVTVSNFFGGTGSITVQIDTATYNELYGTDANLSTFTFQRGLTGTANVNSAEVIVGTDGNDVINGNGGFYDSLYGGNGNDAINGGSGSDWMRGGNGNDTLIGAGGNDYLRGDAGYDILNGGAGIDRADYNRADEGVIVDLSLGKAMYDGEGGQDTLIGIEDVRGSAFNDLISGDANANRLEGRDGDDILTGGGGNDSLLGGDGADTFRFNAFGEGNDVIEDFTVGQDSLSFATSLGGNVAGSIASVVDDGANVVATFTNGGKTLTLSNVGDGTIDTAAEFVNTFVGASFGALKVLGDTGNNPLNGSSEDDALIGGAGNDTLAGGQGNDFLDGGAGNDIYNFTAGDGFDGIGAGTYNTGDIIRFNGTYYDLNYDWDDTHLYVAPAIDGNYNFSDTGSITLGNFFGGTGSVAVQFDLGADNDIYGTNPDLSTVIFQRGLTGTNNATTSEVIIGTAGNDVINGNGGYYDALYGNDGNDTINGGAGNDRILGGAGNDILNGAGGDDILRGNAGFDILNGGAGFDLADYRGAASGVMVDLSQNKALDDGYGSQDTFTGIDDVRGSSYDDIILGDANGNYLYGLEGNDILAGGTGNDVSYGGDGADTFRFNSLNDGSDDINDFDRTQDVLSFAKSLDVGNNGILDDIQSAQFVYDDGTYIGFQFSGGGIVFFRGMSGFGYNSIDDLVDDVNTQITTFDTFVGNAAANILVGAGADDILAGAGGNDSLTGALGNDRLEGGADNDTLTGGLGNDYLDGGAGNDIYNFAVGDGFDILGSATYNAGDIIKLQGDDFYDLNYSWNDTDLTVAQAINDSYDVNDTGALTLANFFVGTGSVAVQIDVGELNKDYGVNEDLSTFVFQRGLTGTNNVNTAEVIIGTAGNDTINGNGGFYDALYGGDGNDTINGGAGTDWIRAGDGNDILNGAGGDDYLRGEAGFDILNGGAGIDQADYRNSDAAVTVDLTLGKAENDGFGYEDTLTGIENVRGSAFNDLIVGDTNANVLRGLDGDDTLTGGGGNDTLDGGAGGDTFRFAALGEGNDSVDGFDVSQDKLAFADILDTEHDGILDNLQAATTVSDDGTDVLVTFSNGGSLTFHGIGTGAINNIADLVADPNSQITTY